jgi:hypothetical protein
MKITRLRTVVVDLPIEPPILSAIFAIRSTTCILCFLETNQGLVGEGLVHAINGLRVRFSSPRRGARGGIELT